MGIHLSISATNVSAYRELAKKLRDAGRKDLRSALRRRIADAGQPVLDEVKEAARGVHVTSTRRVSAGVVGHWSRSAPAGSHGGGQRARREFRAGRAKTAKAAERARRRGGGLREAIASATRLQITARGVRFVINSSRLPENQRMLPRKLDNPKGWRHPLFGRRGAGDWFTEKGEPYFGETIKRRAPKFREAVVAAMDNIKNELEK